ncbi:hypothetical protein [Neptuniibacter sp.]|uniref:hypothetical protein n=1 Tax=Neptuniibacter sp. TaxID=1962643 RepID=UPI0026159463|nr:hypothetical protein [Neptuniibacter sp.]MCP4596226.1 hypothetical protein [Neptuniibacter sp.]
MNLYTSITIEFPWFGGWDWELGFNLDLANWVWFDGYKDSGKCGDTILGKEIGSTGVYWDVNVQILCFGFSLEGIKT